MTLTMSQALDAQLNRHCCECAAELPVRGAQCGACGALPGVTRAELEESLSEPGQLTVIEARQLIEEGREFQQEARARFAEAQRLQAVAVAEADRAAAQGRLESALGELKHAEGALRKAEQAEADAAGPLHEAYENHRQAIRAEEAARRLRQGPAAETEALARLTAATDVLARYQAPAREATGRREAAETVVASAEAAVAAGEDARDRAVLAVEQLSDPGVRLVISPETGNLIAEPMMQMARKVFWKQATENETLLVQAIALALAQLTGVAMNIGLQAEKAAMKRRDAEEAKKPRVSGATVLAPGARAVPGGVYSPGART